MIRALFKRPVGVGMSLIATLMLGLIAYRQIPLQLIPDGLDPPFLFVYVPTLAASSGENELAVAEPIEEALSTLSCIENMRGFVRGSSVGFALNLRKSEDTNIAYQRIRERMRAVTPKLPLGSRFAFIWRHDPNDQPVYVVGVEPPDDCDDPAGVIEEQLLKQLERIEGVSQVSVTGLARDAVRVTLRPADLKRAQLTASQVRQSLARDHFTLSAGVIEGAHQREWVRVSSRFESLEALRERSLSPLIKLKDVASVAISPDPNPTIYRINGRPAAALSILKASSANTIEVTQRIEATLTRLIQTKPELRGFKTRVFIDQGAFILSSLNQIKSSALYGGLIAIACLLWFLRSLVLTLLISSAIPLSLLCTVGILYLRGESLNILTMMGLILSVGMVIDNAIVVLEQVARHRDQGLSPREAAIRGASGVALAITLATLTTLVVFLPLMMVSDQPMLAFFISKVGAPVSYGLLASLVIALVHLPIASQRLMSRREAGTLELGSGERALAEQDISKGHIKERDLSSRYNRALMWVFKHRLWASLMTLAFLGSIQYPLSHLTRTNQGGGSIMGPTVHIVGPLNGPQDRLLAVTQELEATLIERAAELDIDAVIAEPGWSSEHVKLTLSLKGVTERELSASERVERLKALLPERPGYRIRLFRGQGSRGDEGLTVSLFGPDLESTTALAERLAERLERLEGVGSAELELPEGAPELTLSLDPTWSALRGLTPGWVAQSLNAELQAQEIGRFYGEDRELEIIIEPEQEGLSPDNVGQTVPPPPALNEGELKENADPLERPYEGTSLAGVSSRQLRAGLGKIRRMKRKVYVELQVSAPPGDEEAERALMGVVEPFLDAQVLPIGYGIDKGERYADRAENERGGLFAVLTGVLLVLCIMGVLFESFMVPLAIFFTIPLAFVGAFWMLWLSSTPLEVMAIIGGVILVGVVVNHGIVLIDQVQGLRREGLSREQAIIEAAEGRMRPILMTALTTIGGLIPMAIGSAESVGIDYRPLGRVVIGGMIASTLLTLVVVPLFYTLLDDISTLPRRLRALIGRVRGKDAVDY